MNLFTRRLAIQVNKSQKLKDSDYICQYLPLSNYDQIPPEKIKILIAAGKINQIFENKDYRLYQINKTKIF